MKLSAIVSRATNKDYIDLYYILQEINLKDLLIIAKKKMPELDQNLILKSLVYFNDIIEEPIVFKNDKEISFLKIKKFLIKQVELINV